jgi:lycopene beta-cyclase
MDASVEQQGGYRFVYVLPFDGHRLLIEDTHYVDSAAWTPDRLRANIAAYAEQRAAGASRPCCARNRAGCRSCWQATSTASGRTWPASPAWACAQGCSTRPPAIRCRMRCAWPSASPPCATSTRPRLFAAIRDEAAQEWRRQRFFRLLNRMLFLAGSPDRRWRVMQRFYRLPASLIARFLRRAAQPGRQGAHSFSGKPPVPLKEAFIAACKIHPHQIRKAE